MELQEHASAGEESPWRHRPEGARHARMSLRQFDALIASGDIPVSRIGRRVLIHVDDIDAYLRAQRTSAA